MILLNWQQCANVLLACIQTSFAEMKRGAFEIGCECLVLFGNDDYLRDPAVAADLKRPSLHLGE